LKKLLYIIICLAGFFAEASSQQVPLYSQYMLNGFLLNPAVAGSEGYTAVNLTAREQWIGMKHAPGTYALSFQTRILKKSYISRGTSVRKRNSGSSRGGKVGLGGYIFSDHNGAVKRTGIKGTYAYHINFRHSQLSFGLSVVGYQFSLDDDLIHLLHPGDELWLGANKSVFIPDADFGVYYTARNYWGGFSVDQLFESTLKIGDSGYDRYVMERNYYLIGGYDFELSRDIVLSSSTLLKYAGQSIIVLAGVSVDKFIFGYAYDIGLNSIMKYSYGTHEFTFIAKFGDNARRYRWLNRF